jgi:hypothetical protein
MIKVMIGNKGDINCHREPVFAESRCGVVAD